MPRYKNVGGTPWRRPSGEVVPPGATFVATAREHQRVLRRGHIRTRLELVEEVGPAEFFAEDWPLRMSPTMYLKLYPKGKHAPLARQITGVDTEPPSEGGES